MQMMPRATPATPFRDPHPAGKETIFGLQGLRFVAAAMVVMTHALNREVWLYQAAAPLPRAAWMEAGVDIFFVISGFIMVYIIKPETQPGAFWLQRFTRIAPLYWLATAIAFVGGMLLPEWFFGRQDTWFALRSALFVPLGDNSDAHPIISPGWTLIYEFAFYTILAGCMLLRRPPFALAVGIIGTILILGALMGKWLPWLSFYGDQLLMGEFVFGMASAAIVRRLSLRPAWGLLLAATGLIGIFFLWYAPPEWPRGVRVGLPALLTVVGILTSEPLWQRHGLLLQFARLGDASYSIYIVHFFFVTALLTLFQKSEAVRDSFGPYGFVALAMIVGLGSGILTHIFIEKPLLRLVRSLLPKRRPRPALAAPAKV